MSMIQVEDLSFTYEDSGKPVFEHVNFMIDTDWKLGFVGRNGRGKTTFLSLLMGKMEYTGKIHSNVRFDYFPFEVSDESRMTLDILYEIEPTIEEWMIFRELNLLEVNAEVLYRPFFTLSQGEKTKVLLAVLFLRPEHFLLIDEPTNHLDAQARLTLMKYLRKKKGFILVCHDRMVLDGCIDHVLAINRMNIEVQAGNYSSWLETFFKRQTREAQENERLKKDIQRLKESSKRTAMWSDKVEASKIGAADKGYVGHKAAKMMKRSKTIENRQKAALDQKRELLKNAEEVQTLKLEPLVHHSRVLVSYQNVSVCYEKKPICAPVSFSLERKDRMFLEGRNGSGKSSLIKLLFDDSISYTGWKEEASGLVISYVSQDTSSLKGDLSEYAKMYGIDESLYKSLLRKMGLEREQFRIDMENFSDGQKKKAMLARSLCEKAHLYIWDEPLNFIDIYTRKQIEDLILQYEPTMLLVEHDVSFRDRIMTKSVTVQQMVRYK